MRQKVIIIRWAPTSGKSTIGEKLRNFDKKIVWLKTDNFKFFFSEPGETRILDEVMETCLKTLENLLDRGYSVVYEGIFKNPDYANKALELANSKNIPSKSYQLVCSLNSLKERDRSRKGVKEGCREPMPEEIIESLHKKVSENPINNAISLNTEEKSIDECVELIRKNFET